MKEFCVCLHRWEKIQQRQEDGPEQEKGKEERAVFGTGEGTGAQTGGWVGEELLTEQSSL